MQFREINDKYKTDKIRLGYPTTEVLGDELDSAIVYLTDIDEIDVKPYDEIELIDLNNDKSYYLVANFIKEFSTFQSPYKYNYQISLMSLTKKLETIVLPNLTITNIGQNRSVGFYIRQAENYCDFDVNIYVDLKLDRMICPELTFEKPTLREYLDALYGQAGYISRLTRVNEHYLITFQDLNERLSQIDRSYIVELKTSATAEDYVNSLESEINEYIGKEYMTEMQQLKSEDYVFDSRNAKLILTHNIYDLKKVLLKDVKYDIKVVGHCYSDGYEEGTKIATIQAPLSTFTDSEYITYSKLDITKYIVSKEVFETLELLKAREYNPNDEEMISKNYKNNSLYFSRGSNTIENFNFQQESTLDWLLGDDKTAFEYIIRSLLNPMVEEIIDGYKHYGEHNNSTGYWSFTLQAITPTNEDYIASVDTNWKNAVFEIEYYPYSSIRMSIEKPFNERHNVQLFNNQIDSLVDINSFIKQSIEKVKQLGNEALEFSARSNGTIKKIRLGQMFDDYVLSKLETVHYLEQTYYKGVLYKNFSNRNIYTILNRTKRYTALANEKESVVRHEVKKKTIYIDLGNSNSVNEELNKYLIPSKYVKFENNITSGFIYPTCVNSENTIIYTAEFLNNASYGIKRSSVIKDTNYETLEYLKYVDEYGESEDIYLTFYENQLNKNDDFVKDFPKNTINTQGYNDLFSINYHILKDNREHIKLSFEVIFKSNNDKILIGSAFSTILKDKQVIVKEYNEKISLNIDTSEIHGDYIFNLDFKTPLNMVEGKSYLLFNGDGVVLIINDFSGNLKNIVLK